MRFAIGIWLLSLLLLPCFAASSDPATHGDIVKFPDPPTGPGGHGIVVGHNKNPLTITPIAHYSPHRKLEDHVIYYNKVAQVHPDHVTKTGASDPAFAFKAGLKHRELKPPLPHVWYKNTKAP